MKRAAKNWLEEGAPWLGDGMYTEAHCRDILDSDARQAAELRRLRAENLSFKRQLCRCAQIQDGTGKRLHRETCGLFALKPARRKP